MNLDQVPYVLLTHRLEISKPGAAKRRFIDLWICLNLMDHRAVGIALEREAAMAHLSRVIETLARRDQKPAEPEKPKQEPPPVPQAPLRIATRSFPPPVAAQDAGLHWEVWL